MTSSPRQRGPRQPGPWGDFGREVARRRRELGLTQRDLADLAAVSFSTVQALEAGRVAVRVDSVHRILRAVGWALVAVPVRQAQRLSDAVLLPTETEPPAADHD
ncbi:MAG: helix-turn-helix domain-containing protein [Mycobacteriales bacterium]